MELLKPHNSKIMVGMNSMVTSSDSSGTLFGFTWLGRPPAKRRRYNDGKTGNSMNQEPLWTYDARTCSPILYRLRKPLPVILRNYIPIASFNYLALRWIWKLLCKCWWIDDLSLVAVVILAVGFYGCNDCSVWFYYFSVAWKRKRAVSIRKVG
jgi:hypothetical protein